MSYTEVIFTVMPADPGSEILVAQLAEAGFESFEETSTGVKAYIRAQLFEEGLINSLGIMHTGSFQVSYRVNAVRDENWNQIWESSYEPVFVLDKVYIRASFHAERPDIPYGILIDPKMSFGTAHHETTAQMIEQMLVEDLAKKSVLDMGTGTAVLAILAEMLGAKSVVAIDNDTNSVENARENVLKNNCVHIDVQLGTAEKISGRFDVILANINKNILIADMGTYAAHLAHGGVILFSGFYQQDLDELTLRARQFGLAYDRVVARNNWAVARFIKK